MSRKISIPLDSGEWNTIINALNHKILDRNNSMLARKHYKDALAKLIKSLYEEQQK